MTWMIMTSDLDEYDVSVELEDGRIRLVVAPDGQFDSLMTSMVAVGNALGYKGVPMPIYCDDAFRQWVLDNGLHGVGFEPALGADLWEVEPDVNDNDLYSPKGGMLFCNDATKQLLEASPFHCSFIEPP